LVTSTSKCPQWSGRQNVVMPFETALDRARRAWADLAAVPVHFPSHGVVVAVSAGSRLCPPGWGGVVALGGAAIVTVPHARLVPVIRETLAGQRVATVADLDQVRISLSAPEVLGPACLAFLDDADFRPVGGPVEDRPADHADLAMLLASVDPADAEECGLQEITSRAFVIRGRAGLVAAAGYRHWPGSVAHLSVLTAPEHRGQGLARTVASAAVEDARRQGCLPQWRARPAASRRVAQALGFRELGAQLSFRPEFRSE
jgi:GNAT superfamily N-acetyltransferase